jgi:glutathione S-transferase
MLELYHDWDAFCCIKVRFCLAEKGVPWAGWLVDLQRMEQLRPEFLALNPNGVVPVLVHDGRILTESSFINEYVNEVFEGLRLVPFDPLERHAMRVWVKFEDDVLHPAVKGPTYQLILRQSFRQMPRDTVEERIRQAPTPQKAALLRQAWRTARPTWQASTQPDKRWLVLWTRWRPAWRIGPGLPVPHSPWPTSQLLLWSTAWRSNCDVGLWRGKPALEDWIGRIKNRPGYQAALPKPDKRVPAPLEI